MKQTTSHIQRRKNDAADRKIRHYQTTKVKMGPVPRDTLRIVPLGGQNGIGEKNMIVVEYNDDAIVLDCGFNLGIELPGVNYAIPAVDYLQSIKHKLRGYVISHGHMDHIGGLIHIAPECPAPIIGSRFTIGMVGVQFEKASENGLGFQPELTTLDMDSHERLQLGAFTIELVRVTHSVPESSAIVIDTPVGRLVNTGDFRLDPEPLDAMPSDITRLKQLGNEGVLLLMSESTNTTRLGRTPTEHTLQKSFNDLIQRAVGRVFIGVFSTNMNRIQMIVNAAAAHNRKVVLDGRSMMATAELAVRLGNLKIPKETLVPMREAVNLPDDRLVVVCTGGQGEPGAAMTRMAAGEHQYLKLKRGDTAVISSTPIPGNERSYQRVGDDLARIEVKQYRHPTHEIDGCGPLHVSGHAARDEHAEMIQLTQPQYVLPIYGGALNRQYHKDIARAAGMRDQAIIMADNGVVIEFGAKKVPQIKGSVTAGARLVDQTGAIVPGLVIKDRLLLQDDGVVVVIVTLDRKTGRLLSSPDIITRGTISIRDNVELVEALRMELRQAVRVRRVSHATLELSKLQLKERVVKFIAVRTQLTPIVIPVITFVQADGRTNRIAKPVADAYSE